MKRPSLSFNKEAVGNFFLNHIEKIVVALVGAFACTLLWGGIDALRSKTVRREHRPDAVLDRSKSTTGHIDRVPRPPDDVIVRKKGLAAAIEPWIHPEVADPTEVALLDKPLFQELSKRTKPDVYPIEELRAVAGIAVLSVPPREPAKQAGGNRDVDPDPRAEAKPPAAPEPAQPPAATVRARIVPYVIVTGLVPAVKQFMHYRQRYESTSFRDQKRDEPLWSDYVIERCIGPAGGAEKWERIDLQAAAKRFRQEWTGVQPEPLPPQFLLNGSQVRFAKPGAAPDQAVPGAGYCGPLPQLTDGTWGVESLHPRFLRELRKMAAERTASNPPGGNPSGTAPPPPPPPSMPDHRLFRFVDTDVKSGQTYRYRVRLSVWNPNFKLPAQHLAEASLAKDPLLASAASNTTASVTVPGSTTILARAERKAETKRLKSGLVEILVLGENPLTGDYSLRSLITEVGGMVNVDKRLNRPVETRTRGVDIVTNRIFIDMRGRQEDRDDGRAAKTGPRPEPIEMLLLCEDGSFEVVTTADSQTVIDRYVGSLPLAEEAKSSRDRKAEPATDSNEPNPFGTAPLKK
jgi:hypothetical protein